MEHSEAFRTSLISDRIFSPEEIDEMIDAALPDFDLAWTNKKWTYYNVVAAFDIETSSFYKSKTKTAIMYEWSFGLDGMVMIGRTWNDFLRVLNRIVERCHVSYGRRLIIYVHNLAFEFQFIRHWLRWKKVFAISSRTPIYALADSGIEFRCSYLLSGYSLAKLGDELRTYEVKKAIGDLDYSLLRHSETPLTDAEIGYCANDVRVVMAYVKEMIERDGAITRLPLTKTGYVRRFCRDNCLRDTEGEKSWKGIRYQQRIHGLQLQPDEYKQLKRAFQGGFTHANPFSARTVVGPVEHYDFTSSYPSVLVAEKYPMSSAQTVRITSKEEFEKNLRLYCCMFDLEIFELRATVTSENYLSRSRCRDVQRAIINNGRIVAADHLITTVTEQDFKIIRNFYTWGRARISNFRRYRKGYLPTDFVKAILALYKDKTELKGVAGKEIEYARSKEMLNSCYGMTVTDIVRDEIDYKAGEWTIAPSDPEKDLQKYNNNPGRFLFYPWGVWVTAYARRNLFTAIREFGPDYVYSDTDSVVVRNADDHREYFDEYNKRIREQLLRACKYHGIDPEAIEPETNNGERKLLGAWDFEGHYSRFKTLGAKRYLIEYSNDPRNPAKKRGHFSLTVAGLSKYVCLPWMLEKYGADHLFDGFDDNMDVPAAYSGKLTHTYIDGERSGTVTDYTGRKARFHELSAVHMEGAEYSLSLAQEYADYLADLIEETKMRKDDK